MDDLFQAVATTVPSSLGKHAWYIVAASALLACKKPEALASLYTYLQDPKSGLSSPEKAQVSARLQDVMGKAWTLVGIPLVVIATAALAKVENEENGKGEEEDGGGDGKEEGEEGEEKNGAKEKARGGEEWRPPQLDAAITERGNTFLQTLYRSNLSPIFESFGSHAPFMEWLERSVIYGLFLSDHTLLTPVESSLTILTSIMCQGIRAPTAWHLRGLRRLGVSEEDVEQVQEGVKVVARWAGKSQEEVAGWVGVKEEEVTEGLTEGV